MKGVVCAVLGAACWGISGVCVQFVQQHSAATSPFITCARDLIAALIFVGFALLVPRLRQGVKAIMADPHTRRSSVVFGAFLFANQITYICAISETNAGTATVLESLSIAMILVVTCVRARRRPSAIEGAGLVCALGASWMIATQGSLTSLNLPIGGLVWGLLTALAATMYIVFPGKLYARFGSLPVVTCGFVFCALFALVTWAGLSIFGLAGGPFEIPVMDVPSTIVLIVGVGMLGTFVAFMLYLYGVSKVGPVVGGMLGAVEPASATFVMAAWLGSAISGADWLGLALMICMIVLVSLPKRRSRKA